MSKDKKPTIEERLAQLEQNQGKMGAALDAHIVFFGKIFGFFAATGIDSKYIQFKKEGEETPDVEEEIPSNEELDAKTAAMEANAPVRELKLSKSEGFISDQDNQGFVKDPEECSAGLSDPDCNKQGDGSCATCD